MPPLQARGAMPVDHVQRQCARPPDGSRSTPFGTPAGAEQPLACYTETPSTNAWMMPSGKVAVCTTSAPAAVTAGGGVAALAPPAARTTAPAATGRPTIQDQRRNRSDRLFVARSSGCVLTVPSCGSGAGDA